MMPEADSNVGDDDGAGAAGGRHPPQQENQIATNEDQREREENVCIEDGEDDKGVRCCVRDGWGLKLSPMLLLIMFVYCNMLNYIDRGLVNGVLPKYCVNCVDRQQEDSCNASRSCIWENVTDQGETCEFNPAVKPQVGIGGSFNIGETAQGVLAGAFMGGYCIFSPLIALLATLYPPFSLMGLGLSAWVVAAGMGATAGSYHAMVAARVVSGLGEASFQCLAPCFIDDGAPQAVKGKWLAAFFMAVPIGQALGYVFGGYMCSELDADRLGFAGWRLAFAAEGAAMLPVCLLCFFVTNKLRKTAEEGAKSGEEEPEEEGLAGAAKKEAAAARVIQRACRRSFRWHPPAAPAAPHPPRSPAATLARTLGSIVGNGVWVCTVCGYGAFTFSLGAAAVWGPYYVQRVFRVPLAEADAVFGGVAVLTGLLGTLSGGLLLDIAQRRLRDDPQTASLLLASALVLLAWPLCVVAFWVESYESFLALMFLGQLLAFAAIPTVNGVLLWCVPAESRPLSMALSVVGIHLLGDVPSPAVVGAMLERVSNPRVVLMLVMAWIGWCLVFWIGGCFLSRRRHAAARTPASDLTAPLLDAELTV